MSLEKTFFVCVIDQNGIGSWEEVVLNSSNHAGFMFGTIIRTGRAVKFWDSSNDSEDDYTGTFL